jgi:hypothetical protein
MGWSRREVYLEALSNLYIVDVWCGIGAIITRCSLWDEDRGRGKRVEERWTERKITFIWSMFGNWEKRERLVVRTFFSILTKFLPSRQDSCLSLQNIPSSVRFLFSLLVRKR